VFSNSDGINDWKVLILSFLTKGLKNMKKLIAGSILFAAVGLSGCATSMPIGGLYTNLKLPITATSNHGGTKIGTATCQSVLGLIAQGDCSLETAMKNGHITKVTHVDWEANNILGIIGNYKLTVYGE
jgi:TRL-like protein family